MRILSRTAPSSKLVEDYLSGTEPARRLFGGGHPGELDAYRRRLPELDQAFDRGARTRLAEILTGGGESRRSVLERFVASEGLAVTTGQQPGLLGGPLFALYKGLSAAALASRLEILLDRPVIPVFWVASQDHDWEEVRRTHLPDAQNELRTIELSLPAGMPPHPFHVPRFDSALEQAREELLGHVPDSDFSARWTELLEQSHGGTATLAEAEARLLEGLLGPAGVFVFRPEDPAAAEAALPVLLSELDEAEVRATRVRTRADEIEAAGYELQVPVLEGGVNLFLGTDEGRQRLFLDGDGRLRTRQTEALSDPERIADAARKDPTVLSPNVLLRPVVESMLIPTLAYVAGPGESAYFPQTEPLFEALGRTPPVVHPRLSAFLIESKIQKVLDKFDLELDELRRPHHELAGRLARDEMPEALRSAMGNLRGAIARGSREVSEAVTEIDPTLTGTVDGIRSQGFAALDDLERKVTQAIKRENEIALSQVEKAQLHLFPNGVAQERVISPFYYLFRYGPDLLDRLAEAASEALRLPAANPASGDSAAVGSAETGNGG